MYACEYGLTILLKPRRPLDLKHAFVAFKYKQSEV